VGPTVRVLKVGEGIYSILSTSLRIVVFDLVLRDFLRVKEDKGSNLFILN
jgi:hypothetical protein